MAKRKQAEPIVGISQVPLDKLTVLKSNPLTSLWRSELTLSEFKILDVYLSRINSHHPEHRRIEISKEEFEEVFGISKFNLRELDTRLKHLVGQAVRISDGDYKKGFAWVSLFEEACVDLDTDGVQTVYLECTQKAMKYFFNCENIGYLRYKLRCVKDMKSRYTYILFLYLEKNRYRTEWEVSLDDLKVILNCDHDELYQEYKFFNQRILQRSKQEILKKTECRFDYYPVKKGRRVVAIRFVVYPLDTIEPASQDITTDQLTLAEYVHQTPPDDAIEFLRDACCLPGTSTPEFSREEMQQIFETLVTIPEKKLPSKEALPVQSIEMQRYHYLREKYAAMERAAAHKPIKHRFSYFLAIIKRDRD